MRKTIRFHLVAILQLAILSQIGNGKDSPTPLVIWPGMGDSCYNDFSIGHLTKYFVNRIPGLHVHCISIGDSWLRTTLNSFVSNIDDMIEEACRKIGADPELREGFNAIGFSQGSQFLRGVAQRCPYPPMRTLISVGGQHRGIYGLPMCGQMEALGSGLAFAVCDAIRSFVSILSRLPLIRSYSVQAQYWRDPYETDSSQTSYNFIADLNQEHSFNFAYKKNLLKLKNFVLIRFLADEMVVPSESQWFGFYKNGQSIEVEPLQRHEKLYLARKRCHANEKKSDVIIERDDAVEDDDEVDDDPLGLRQMEAEGRLHFIAVEGGHLQLSGRDIDNLIQKYLK